MACEFYTESDEVEMLLLDKDLKKDELSSIYKFLLEDTGINCDPDSFLNDSNINNINGDNINDDDDHEYNGNDNDDSTDIEITDHHREIQFFKHLNWNQVYDFIKNMGYHSKNRYVCRQAAYLKEKLLTIRQELRDENLILRPTYKNGGYHLDSMEIFQKKAFQFMIQHTQNYSLIFKLSHTYPDTSQNYLSKIVEPIEITLNNLLNSKSVTETQYNLMKIDRSSVRLHYLYFAAQTHKKEIPVQPIMICNNGPTIGISHFLGHLLDTLFNDVTYCKKFSNSVNVIRKMEIYNRDNRFKPTTLFASFNIDDLCLSFIHKHVIQALENFLTYNKFNEKQLQGMTISTIINLVQLVLNNQYFVYNYKLYQQIAGGASGSLLTIPLVYIYLFYWQPNLTKNLIDKRELFFRYRDEAFITWNKSEDELRTILQQMNDTFPQPIWTVINIDKTLIYHDIKLHNYHGILRTGIYRLPNYQSDQLLPILHEFIQRPIKENIWKWLRQVLLKAVRYCSYEITFIEAKLDILFQLEINNISKDYLRQATFELEEDFGPRQYHQKINRSNYELMRENILNYDMKNAMKKLDEKYSIVEETKKHHINNLNIDNNMTMINFFKDVNLVLKYYFGNQIQVKEIPKKYPKEKHNIIKICIDELLIKKRPNIEHLKLPSPAKINT